MLETTRRHLFLAGFMGTGKTAVGRAVAERLRFGFIDLDDMITSLAHKPIHDIFRIEGEDAFRLLESRALRLAVIAPHSVIALGGGAPLLTANANVIHATGRCWLLTAAWETIWERVREEIGRRPLLAGPASESGTDKFDFDEFKILVTPLMEKRQESYLRIADHVLDTSSSTTDELAVRIVDEFTMDAAIGTVK